MNIKVNFIGKLSKVKTIKEIVFIKGNKIKKNILNPIIKPVLNNKLFQDLLFFEKEYKSMSYVFVNCTKLSTSSDYENIGSKLFDYLKKNKIENAFIATRTHKTNS